jgi:phosphatidylglycerophosphate synthase
MATKRADLAHQGLKRRDFWWTVLVIDPIAMVLLPWILRLRWLTPTRITFIALFLGALSIGAFATGAFVVGAVLYQVRFLADCLDGKVARITGNTSAWGRFVDLAGDTATIGAAYAAVAAWAFHQGVDGAWMVLIVLPLFGTTVWLHQYERGLPPSETTSPPATAPAREDAEAATEPATEPQARIKLWSLDRLYRHPGSVDLETLMLLVYPVMLPLDWYPYVAGIAALFYLASGVEVLVALRRRLKAQDAATRSS